MRVPWEQDVLLLVCALDDDGDKSLERVLDLLHLVKQPEPHVRCDLVVARAPRVQLPAHGSDELDQPAFIGRVDVLVARFDLELLTQE